MNYEYIVIEGAIGAGKTSLAELLAQDFNAELVLERFVDNNFLPKFYKDPEHYAFPLEMTFLTDRYQQLKDLLSKRDLFKNLVIADYFIDKCLIFSKNNLNPDEYALFKKVYDMISAYLPKPDLLIYLHKTPENLLKNIIKRGRSYEQNIELSYLDAIQENYITYLKQWESFPVLMVESDHLDFVNNREDYLKLRDLTLQSYPVGITPIIF